MRVYVPDKKDAIINEVLKELYLLRQAIEHGVSNTALWWNWHTQQT